MGSALALAKAELNDEEWMAGKGLFDYSSRNKRVHDIVGEGGTLWVCKSTSGARDGDGGKYSLLMKIDGCHLENNPTSRFGQYAVVGDPGRSKLFAQNDAALVLLALRFANDKKIENRSKIGNALQQIRELTPSDSAELERFSEHYSSWEVFLSYSRKDEASADEVSDLRNSKGTKTFQDKKSLEAGELWWSAIEKAIEQARALLLIVGKDTSQSEWVKKELACAHRHNKKIIPILLEDGSLDGLKIGDRDLADYNAIKLSGMAWQQPLLRKLGKA